MIETSGLTKRFDDILAVDHISAKIRDGSVFGLIGTNGAGKSTFLRMVSGICGSIYVPLRELPKDIVDDLKLEE